MANKLISTIFQNYRNNRVVVNTIRRVSGTNVLLKTKYEFSQALAVKDQYFDQKNKDRETFFDLIQLYKNRAYKTGHVEFIYAAMRRMKEYDVHEDVEAYKMIVDILPKGTMVCSNHWLGDMAYYPKHQVCVTELLLQMEENRVIPDRDMGKLLLSIFGLRSRPYDRYRRMIYWLPKMKYASPWPPPEPRPKTDIDAAKLSVEQMCSVDLETKVTLYKSTEDELATEDTWIVSGQSPIQRKLLQYHPDNHPIYLEGGFRMYLGKKDTTMYYILRTDMPASRRRKPLRDPDDMRNLKIPFLDAPTPEDLIPDFSVHEQRDGIIYGIAATGTSSEQSLLSWIRILEKNGNERLKNVPIIFRNLANDGTEIPINLRLESGEKKTSTNEE